MPRALTDRVRVERRGAITENSDVVQFDEGDAVEFETNDPVEFAGGDPGDGYGNAEDTWGRIGPAAPLRCEIRELRAGAGEVVEAEKLAGLQPCLVLIRNSAFARSIRVEDRLVEYLNGGGERILNIRAAYPPTRDARFITLLCESGVAT